MSACQDSGIFGGTKQVSPTTLFKFRANRIGCFKKRVSWFCVCGRECLDSDRGGAQGVGCVEVVIV